MCFFFFVASSICFLQGKGSNAEDPASLLQIGREDEPDTRDALPIGLTSRALS